MRTRTRASNASKAGRRFSPTVTGAETRKVTPCTRLRQRNSSFPSALTSRSGIRSSKPTSAPSSKSSVSDVKPRGWAVSSNCCARVRARSPRSGGCKKACTNIVAPAAKVGGAKTLQSTCEVARSVWWTGGSSSSPSSRGTRATGPRKTMAFVPRRSHMLNAAPATARTAAQSHGARLCAPDKALLAGVGARRRVRWSSIGGGWRSGNRRGQDPWRGLWPVCLTAMAIANP